MLGDCGQASLAVTDYTAGSSFDLPSWLPMKGWAYTGGDYMIVVRGDQFMIAERAKLGSLDELDRLTDSRPS